MLEPVATNSVQELIALLEGLAADPRRLAELNADERLALMAAAGRIARPDEDETRRRRQARRHKKREQVLGAERAARAATGIRVARQADVFQAPARLELPDSSRADADTPELGSPRRCYVCDCEFTRLHFFYDALCRDCGDFNYRKRFQSAPLHGRTALITGSRLKIGYQATLLLLRAGARVIATTRFPVDSALRFSRENDFNDWKDRLMVYGLDLRHTPSVELFASLIEESYDRLDILINNAAQTVRRPPGFYAHLMANETRPFEELPAAARALLREHATNLRRLEQADTGLLRQIDTDLSWHARIPGIGLRSSAALSQIPYRHDSLLPVEETFPAGELDADLQQVDLREVNSWRLRLGEIETAEMLELQLVNAVAPFVLCNRFANMMRRDRTGEKHIVNVSAMEGKFYRFKKPDRHPHTNMAKAALNMLTHTAAAGLARDGIFMNAVDTGWVTDEDPVTLARFKREHHDFEPPLDIVDGAARVCDPFFDGLLTGRHQFGKFLKDYHPIDW